MVEPRCRGNGRECDLFRKQLHVEQQSGINLGHLGSIPVCLPATLGGWNYHCEGGESAGKLFSTGRRDDPGDIEREFEGRVCLLSAEPSCFLLSPQHRRKHIIPGDFRRSPCISILGEVDTQRKYFHRLRIAGRSLLDPGRHKPDDHDGAECVYWPGSEQPGSNR